MLGHEACVEIVDHKRANSDLKIGDRVTFSIADSCGNCEFCLNDLSQKCTKLFKVTWSEFYLDQELWSNFFCKLSMDMQQWTMGLVSMVVTQHT